MGNSKRAVRLTALVAGLTLVAAGCGGDGGGDGGGGGGGAGGDPLDGKTFTVGSKEFTEQLILGQIAIQVLEDAGATVKDETGITGTANVRTALESDEIDMYWEYTGTGWTDILGNESADASTDAEQLFTDVSEQDSEANDIAWIAKSTANDTYAFATSQETSESTGVTTLSDYAELVNGDPESATMCAAAEFLDRQDGWPGMEKAYGFSLPDNLITEVDLGLVFEGVPDADPCAFGEVFETDGRIPANDLVVLEDDKNYFVSYEVAMTVNQAVLDDSSELEEVLNPVAEALTTEELTALNSQVDVEGLPVEAVAKKWLEDNDLIG
ncbi:glycine betaine ABC transporter substrate-binding protein [Nocardioides sp. InS609-2]|uniref:glycine betaine ABC transporter substrate-binding protein n=1 Tax=Nocardioides sp. InS609-2 TaxID=2760705 RepID=UPI0020BDA868|nr:glycine betaine ABC transporter substrate-binding protein [Nocardioides sp. InS609-2]